MTVLYKNEQSGRSMVEMLGVLAIIGVLSIGGISGYSKAMAKYRINKTLDQISMLVMNIRTLYASAVNYSGLTNGIAVQMGIIPRDMLQAARGSTVASNITIVNVYGGEINLTASGTDNRNFNVAYSGLPMEACVSIATADWGSQAGSGLQSISVGASAASKKEGTSLTSHAIDTLPLALSTAAGNCSGSGDNGNTIKWTYY